MDRSTTEKPSPPPNEILAPRHRLYLIASVLVWALGALSTHWFGVWVGIGVAAVGLGAWGMLLDDRILADLRRPAPKLFGFGVLAGAFMLAVTYIGYAGVMTNVPSLRGATEELYKFFASLPRAFIPILVPAIIFSEEIVWRGRVQGLLSGGKSPYLAVLVAAILYALAHAPIGSLSLVGIALACGLFWGALRAATGSIVPALVSHMIWDLFVMVLFPLTPPS